MLDTTPIYLDLDRRRQLVFNLNTEILIRAAGGKDASIWETVGTRTNPETGQQENTLDVNLENLRLYLWAGLHEDADRNNETHILEDVGRLLTHRRFVTIAVRAIGQALRQYYGDPVKGEA